LNATACRQYKIGPEKGQLFEAVLQQLKPTWALEVGTFLGYSAIRTARNLQPGGKLLCIEANPQNAAVARQVVQYAGFRQQVQVIDGLSNKVIPQLPALLANIQQQQQACDCVFFDHCKDCYLPDLQSLEQLGLIQQGTTVIADNVIYPGAPGEHMTCRQRCLDSVRAALSDPGGASMLQGQAAVSQACSLHSAAQQDGLSQQPSDSCTSRRFDRCCCFSRQCACRQLLVCTAHADCRRKPSAARPRPCHSHVAGFLEFLESSGRYKTELLRARYEYEQAWNPDWEPNKEDALSVSVCSSVAAEGAA
jgi:predicted O-methyltransferase YrrM